MDTWGQGFRLAAELLLGVRGLVFQEPHSNVIIAISDEIPQ